jgi:hypothetical protein
MHLNRVKSQVSETTRSHVRFYEDSEQQFDKVEKAPPQNTGTSDELDSDSVLLEDDSSKSMAVLKKRKVDSMVESGQISMVSRASDPETSRKKRKRTKKEKINSTKVNTQ